MRTARVIVPCMTLTPTNNQCNNRSPVLSLKTRNGPASSGTIVSRSWNRVRVGVRWLRSKLHHITCLSLLKDERCICLGLTTPYSTRYIQDMIVSVRWCVAHEQLLLVSGHLPASCSDQYQIQVCNLAAFWRTFHVKQLRRVARDDTCLDDLQNTTWIARVTHVVAIASA